MPTAEIDEASIFLPTHLGLPTAMVVEASILLPTLIGLSSAEMVEAATSLPTHVGLLTAEVVEAAILPYAQVETSIVKVKMLNSFAISRSECSLAKVDVGVLMATAHS